MSSPKSPKSCEDSSDNGAQANQGSSPFILSPAASSGPANILQHSTPATVFDPPSHSPSPAMPHFTGALTANFTTLVNPNTAVGRIIARGEATIQALDPFISSSSSGLSNPSYGANIARPPPAVQRGTRTLLRSSRNRVRIEDSPRPAFGSSSQADGDLVVPVVAPVSPIVLQDPDFSLRANSGRWVLRGAGRNITVPAGPRPMPMAANNPPPEGPRRNPTIPAVSQVPMAQMAPPPPPYRTNNTSQQQRNQAAAGIWNQATPPSRPSRAAISTVYPTENPSLSFHPSAAIPPLFANRHIQPIAPLRVPAFAGQPPASPWQLEPWQPEQSHPLPPLPRPERPRSEPSPNDLEHQLEELEQQQRRQLEIVRQRAWDFEQWQIQHDLSQHRHSNQGQELSRQQSEQSLRSRMAPAQQRWTPGGGHFYYQRNGDVVRPAPMSDPFTGEDGGAGSGWIQTSTWRVCYPPPLWNQGGRHGRQQEKRRKKRDKTSPTPGAYDEASGEEKMLGKGGEASSAEPESLPGTPEAPAQVQEEQEEKTQVDEKEDVEEKHE
ncbi:hypothetical protein B0T18DRAFT_433471 [Schizothecium vesticola]|uniref:Uncharacterized protein n=1 Tax=Schizothecium vesticola TaxID=314040 RepID=A0AA40EEN6_9PEZI|nr:hypothetical protein B0T18DRAFT_433471 [Schizothecium vesticola]